MPFHGCLTQAVPGPGQQTKRVSLLVLSPHQPNVNVNREKEATTVGRRGPSATSGGIESSITASVMQHSDTWSISIRCPASLHHCVLHQGEKRHSSPAVLSGGAKFIQTSCQPLTRSRAARRQIPKHPNGMSALSRGSRSAATTTPVQESNWKRSTPKGCQKRQRWSPSKKHPWRDCSGQGCETISEYLSGACHGLSSYRLAA